MTDINNLIENFNHTIDGYISELKRYPFSLLCMKPSENSWSLGQLYKHLIDDTNFYISQIRICLSDNKNINEEASESAKKMFLNNAFPDLIIQGDSSHSSIPQPDSKEQLSEFLVNVKNEMNEVAVLILESFCQGKTKHPGFHYFSAREWLQFADMHFRHHLKQKKRIEAFLEMNAE